MLVLVLRLRERVLVTVRVTEVDVVNDGDASLDHDGVTVGVFVVLVDTERLVDLDTVVEADTDTEGCDLLTVRDVVTLVDVLLLVDVDTEVEYVVDRVRESVRLGDTVFVFDFVIVRVLDSVRVGVRLGCASTIYAKASNSNSSRSCNRCWRDGDRAIAGCALSHMHDKYTHKKPRARIENDVQHVTRDANGE